MTDLYYPLRSLREGHWFKLICGASFQHLPAVRNLVLAYTLAGADCVDVAADPAVISAAKAALQAAAALGGVAGQQGYGYRTPPWLMVSFNDGEDPHFRKAEFDPAHCPIDCPRPCESICPAQAIVFQHAQATAGDQQSFSGVISDRCYGCGRCLPVCPIQHIATRSYVSTPTAIAPLVLEAGIDAIEIHTQVGRLTDFRRLWQVIAPWVNQLKLVAISCPDGEGLIEYLWSLYETISPLACAIVWQTDGRPMSGDIGAGATRAAIKLGQKVLAARLPGYVQLAGGTNQSTVGKLQTMGLLNQGGSAPSLPASAIAGATDVDAYIAGVAYGSYARALLLPVLNQLEALETIDKSQSGKFQSARLETVPELLWQAVSLAHTLVAPLKSSLIPDRTPYVASFTSPSAQ